MATKDSKEIDLIHDYKAVFKSERGKTVIYDLMKKCNMLSTSFNGDINKTIYNEGRRSVMLYILSVIDSDPEALKKHMEDSLHEDDIYNIN